VFVVRLEKVFVSYHLTFRFQQDLDEAKTTVEKRLQYIGDEMCV